MVGRDQRLWVETHGYRRWSLRDRNNRSRASCEWSANFEMISSHVRQNVVTPLAGASCYLLAGADGVFATGLGIAGPVTFNA